jgi:hypothetical protein
VIVSTAAYAQSAPVVLLLDQNAIAVNQPPNMFVSRDINGTIAAVGVRDPLQAFMRSLGQSVTLPGGPAGHEGWFAPGSMPSNWVSATGANDAPQNFWLAGPGLGSPNSSGSRTALLGNFQNLAPLNLSRLQTLVGRQICAVVFANEIPWAQAGTSLTGANRGVVAFSIVSVGTGGNGLPLVTVNILDDGPTCGGALSLVTF